MSDVAVTVLFATYNGARTLPRMLDALCQMTLPRERWKLVAIDNNSNDGTAEILRSYADRLPLEIVLEPRQGKALALETGFRSIEGDLVVLTDDDVIPEPDWLEQFLAVAAENPDFDLFSGVIVPEWETQPEPWVLQYGHAGILYALNDEIAEGPIPAMLISGPNSAFRHAVLGRGYLTHDGLGPDASTALFPMGEDTAFALRLERQGYKAMHTRCAKLKHIIKAAYVEERWMLQRAVRYGMGLVAVRPELFARKIKLAGIPLAATALWLALSPIAVLAKLLPKSRGRFKLLWGQAVRRGVLRQSVIERTRVTARRSELRPSKAKAKAKA
jgi:glycosyltransferase involved in cell wall biosynthesis